jgi:23S rRNA (guanosine2251-2'-O)-methyltransferase
MGEIFKYLIFHSKSCTFFHLYDLSSSMRKLTHSEISKKRISADHIESAPRIPLVVVVDNIRSLYNVGSIFRTSDGAMIEKLILGGFTPHPPRKEIEKTALGSTRSVPWELVKHPVDAIQTLRKRNYKICCLELTDSSRQYSEMKKSDFPLCLVLGNEITGVTKEVIELCDFGMEIPMFGTKQSLNVAVAYGIAVFELAKIWRTS